MSDFVFARLKNLKSSDDGQAIVLVALGLMFILFMAGIGVDAGYLRYQKQQMQKAADSGAIAAAAAMGYNGDFAAAALNDAAANGFVNGMNGVSVVVNNPPQTPDDPFAGDPKYVEVIVSQQRPTFFMNVGGFHGVGVRSRAVASSVNSATGCIYALDPSSAATLKIDNGVTLTASCSMFVNSTNPAALLKVGRGDVIAAGTGSGIGVVGGYAGDGFSPAPQTGIPIFTDPLNTLPVPSYDHSCHFTNLIVTHDMTLSPTTYCNGIKIVGGTVRFTPGTYTLLGGGLTVLSPAARLVGAGVTFYNTADATHGYGPMTVQARGDSNLSAPLAGPLAGILVFQDRGIVNPTSVSLFDSSNGATFTGAVYLAGSSLRFKGLPLTGSYTPLVAWQIEVTGSSLVKNNFLPPEGTSPIPGAALVE